MITCWSRSSECSGRGSVSSSSKRRRVGPGLRPEGGERVVVVDRLGAQQLDPRALLGPELASRSSRPSWSRTSSRDVRSFGPARFSNSWSRPADIRCTSSDSPPSASTIRCLPRRRTPSSFPPASASSGGSKVFSALMPGARADSTPAPATAAPIRRAVISTSGSSGTALQASQRGVPRWRRAAPPGRARRTGPGGCAAPPRPTTT